MPDIRVLIVDDSSFIHKALIRIFESEPAIKVVGIARNGKEAIEKVVALEPDVITLDIMMPGMDGIETLKIIMESMPTPVLMLSQYTREGAELTLNALELGAMDFVDKSSTGIMDFAELAKEIISKVKAIAWKKPIRATIPSETLQGYKGRGVIDVVAIGTSTGGPSALQMLLPKFPEDISFGILIVQHMPKGFTKSLANRLDGMCKIHVKEAEEDDGVEHGIALIAPSGFHMKVREDAESSAQDNKIKRKVTLDAEPMNLVHRPSADVLFSSVAQNYGAHSIGVILTGMGSDGAKGLGMIKEKGGTTLAQDKETSAIFGMPKVAIESGVVDKVLPITSMAEEILKLT